MATRRERVERKDVPGRTFSADLSGHKSNRMAESLGVKNAAWDKHDGYMVPRDCYNSYFYKVEDDSLNLVDKFHLYGKSYTQKLDGR